MKHLPSLLAALAVPGVTGGCVMREARIVSVADGTPVAELRGEADAVCAFVHTPLAKRFVGTSVYLPPISTRTLYQDPETGEYFRADAIAALGDDQRDRLEEKTYDEAYYYTTRYGTPLSYCRAVDLLGAAGLSSFSGRRVLDFGYGMIGQLRMMALLGADVAGVEVNPLLPVLYGFEGDQGVIAGIGGTRGRIKLVHGRYPEDATTREAVGRGYDLILSKNVLKRGYIHPAREVDERMTIDLGVDDATFVAEVFAALKPGGLFMIYNNSPKQNPPDEPYIPWADGECPFSRETLEAAGFEVLALDRDDTEAAREMGALLEWDRKYGIELENDLFAHYTLCRK